MKFLTARFKKSNQAALAVEDLVDASFPTRDIAMVADSRRHPAVVPVRTRTLVPEGAVSGLLVGTGVGALLAALEVVGITHFEVTRLASSPTGAVLGGALAGALGGGLLGTLAGLGLWKSRPDPAEADLGPHDSIVVGVAAPDSRVKEAAEILREAGGIVPGV